MNNFNTISFVPLGLWGVYIIVRLVQWVIRIHRFRKTMPVIPLIIPPRSIIRKLLPKSWQRYHFDWFLHSKGHEYRTLQSDVFAMVCLFEYDTVCVRSAEAFCEMKITDGERFPKDQAQFKLVSPPLPFSRVCVVELIRRVRPLFMARMWLRRMERYGEIIGRLRVRPLRRRMCNWWFLRRRNKRDRCWRRGMFKTRISLWKSWAPPFWLSVDGEV